MAQNINTAELGFDIRADLEWIEEGATSHHMVGQRASAICKLWDAGEKMAAEILALEVDDIQLAHYQRYRINHHPQYDHAATTGTHVLPLRFWAEKAIQGTTIPRYFSGTKLESAAQIAVRCLGLPAELLDKVTERASSLNVAAE